MWHWLNSNASAIEAITSIASVLVTVVLAFITARYVVLTKTLAEAANAQLLGQVEASRARRRKLASHINFLLEIIESLPDSSRWSQADSIMRNSTNWDDFDFADFRALASEVSDAASSYAALVESKMRWMAERVNEIKSTPSAHGYDWRAFRRPEWDEALRVARHALGSIF